MSGSGTEQADSGTAYTSHTDSTLAAGATAWAVTGGASDTTLSGSASSAYAGSGAYVTGSAADGTFGPAGLEARGTAYGRRAGTATDWGAGSSAYGYTVHADPTAGTAAGTGTAWAGGEDHQGYAGAVSYTYPVAGGTLAGAGTEQADSGTAYTSHTDSTLAAGATAWAVTGGASDTTLSGSASSAYAGSGAYVTGSAADGTFGPAGLEARGTAYGRRAGTATDWGAGSSAYGYTVHADPTAGTAAGTGTAWAGGEDHQGYAGAVSYTYPVAGGTLAGAGTEQADSGTAYTSHTDSTLAAGATAWAVTGGASDTTLSGSASSAYAGSGAYVTGSAADGTFGPAGLEARGTAYGRRAGTATDWGAGSSAYGYTVHADPTAGTAAGTGTAWAGGEDHQGYAGAVSYTYPVAGGTLAGAGTEQADSGTAYTSHTDSTLAAGATAWAVTGGASDTTLSGSASSAYAGSGAYVTGSAADGTFGPAGLEARGTAYGRRAGTATDWGSAGSSYSVTIHTAPGTGGGSWTTTGTGWASAGGVDHQGYAGVLTYYHPVAGGTVVGSGTEQADDATGYALQTTSALDPAAGTWAVTGSLLTSAFGSASSTYAGSGAYGQQWTASGVYGPAGLQATGDAHYERSGTATEWGSAASAYRFDANSVPTPDGASWVAVGGSGQANAGGVDHQGYAGVLTYDHPVAGGTVVGSGTEQADDATGYALQTTSALDPAAGTWAVTSGGWDTTLFGTAGSSSRGSGAYDLRWTVSGEFGPLGLRATGDAHYERSGAANEAASADSAYNYVVHAGAAPGASATGSGAGTARGEDAQGYEGALVYDHPVEGGTVAGSGTESGADHSGYTSEVTAALDPGAGTWAATGSLAATALGATANDYQGQGTYGHAAHNVDGGWVFGTETESGGGAGSYTQASGSALGPDGAWAATAWAAAGTDGAWATAAFAGDGGYAHRVNGYTVTGAAHEEGTTSSSSDQQTAGAVDPGAGTWAEAGTGYVLTSYAGDGGGPDGGMQYLPGDSNNGTGSFHEDGTDTLSTTSTRLHTLSPAGSWAAAGGDAATREDGAADQRYAAQGSYRHDHIAGTWNQVEADHSSFTAVTQSTLGADGAWVTTGWTAAAGTGGGREEYTGAGSAADSSQDAYGSSSDASQWNERLSFGWAYGFTAASVLGADGSASGTTGYHLAGSGGGGGGFTDQGASQGHNDWVGATDAGHTSTDASYTLVIGESDDRTASWATAPGAGGGPAVTVSSLTEAQAFGIDEQYQLTFAGGKAGHFSYGGITSDTSAALAHTTDISISYQSSDAYRASAGPGGPQVFSAHASRESWNETDTRDNVSTDAWSHWFDGTSGVDTTTDAGAATSDTVGDRWAPAPGTGPAPGTAQGPGWDRPAEPTGDGPADPGPGGEVFINYEPDGPGRGPAEPAPGPGPAGTAVGGLLGLLNDDWGGRFNDGWDNFERGLGVLGEMAPRAVGNVANGRVQVNPDLVRGLGMLREAPLTNGWQAAKNAAQEATAAPRGLGEAIAEGDERKGLVKGAETLLLFMGARMQAQAAAERAAAARAAAEAKLDRVLRADRVDRALGQARPRPAPPAPAPNRPAPGPAKAPTAGPLPVAQAAGASKDVALGLTHHGTFPRPSTLYPNPREALEVFGRNRNAYNYRYWQREGLSQLSPNLMGFENAFREAASKASTIHFNLDGFNLRTGWQLGQAVDPYAAGVTNWEFAQVLRDPALRQKTVFWQNGQQVPLPRVFERAGIPPNGLP